MQLRWTTKSKLSVGVNVDTCLSLCVIPAIIRRLVQDVPRLRLKIIGICSNPLPPWNQRITDESLLIKKKQSQQGMSYSWKNVNTFIYDTSKVRSTDTYLKISQQRVSHLNAFSSKSFCLLCLKAAIKMRSWLINVPFFCNSHCLC